MTIYYFILIAWFSYAISLKLGLKNQITLTNPLFGFLPMLSLFVLVGLRSTSVGTDTSAYEFEFYNAAIDKRITEPGYSFVNFKLNEFGFSFKFFLILYSALLVGSITWLINTFSKDIFYSYILFFALGFMAFSMSGVRQTIALAFTMIAFIFLMKDKPIKFLFFVLLGSSFHIMTLSFLVVLLFYKWRLDLKAAFLIYALSFITFFVSAPILDYIEEVTGLVYFLYYRDTDSSINPLVTFMHIFIPLIALIFWPKKLSRIYSVLYLLSIINLIIVLFALEIPMLNRLGLYFSLYSVILIPNIVADIDSKGLRLFTKTFGMVIPMLIFAISTPGNSVGIDNYEFGFLD